MKESTQKLMDKVDAAHDWAGYQCWSDGGTRYTSTTTCRVCSLRQHGLKDRQNGIPEWEYRFSDGETGQDLSLRQAAARGCLE